MFWVRGGERTKASLLGRGYACCARGSSRDGGVRSKGSVVGERRSVVEQHFRFS